MTIYVLTAGDGYEYLTRQVASGDAVRAGQQLSAYYAESGYPPGRWLGSGLTGLANGRGLSGQVDTEQMKLLFGAGCDPVTGQPLGQRYRIPPSVDERVAARIAALPSGLDAAAREERVATIRAEETARRTPRPVAGFDCVFTPVKSVSVLWALGDEPIREQVLAAHHAAVEHTFIYMQREVARTRVGAGGIAQVDTRGLLAAAFDHWDARPVRDPDGSHTDPNLHTHLVIANRVQGPDGHWRTVDSKALHQAVVTCSERYNALLADELTRRLGVRFVERQVRRDRQPVREVAGISGHLIAEFSSRRTQVETNLRALIVEFRKEHSREPTAAEQIRLAQTATLAGREDKSAAHPPLGELLSSWRQRANVVDPDGTASVGKATGKKIRTVTAAKVREPLIAEFATAARDAVAARRATWTRWHIEAEVTRQTASLAMVSPDDRDALIRAVTDRALAASICLHSGSRVAEPSVLRRGDGEPVFTPHNSVRYTSRAILDAEQRLVAAAHRRAAPAVDPVLLAAVVDQVEAATGRVLSPDQAHAVRHTATSGRSIDLLIGPAGTGKTTTMRALSAAWQAQHGPGTVLLLAPTAAAARVLSDAVQERGDNLAKWLYETSGVGGQRRHARIAAGDRSPELVDDQARWQLTPGQLVIVDEACLAGTLALDELRRQAETAGAKLLLVGDHAQLPAVEAGGALRLLAAECGAVELTSVWRFSQPWEATASLQLRQGKAAALESYDRHGRIAGGTDATMIDAAYLAWLANEYAGHVSLLIAADNATVAGLNARARAERITTGQVEPAGIVLHDATTAGVGDRVVTRRNDRTLLLHGGRDFVKNGDLWRVEARHADGSLLVRHARHRGPVLLPAHYVRTHVELGYATTAHRAQGMTVDAAHLLVGPSMNRELLYVGMTRGVRANTAYVVTESMLDPGLDQPPAEPATAREVLDGILRRPGAERSATETVRAAQQSEDSLRTLIARYEHARSIADQFHESQAPSNADHRLVAGLLRPAQSPGDGELTRYLHDLGRLIEARALEVASGAVRERQPWLRPLGRAPSQPLARMRYLSAVATVAAYREAYGVVGPDPVDRPCPTERERAEAWSHARRAVFTARRLTTHQQVPKPFPPAPTRADRLLRR